MFVLKGARHRDTTPAHSGSDLPTSEYMVHFCLGVSSSRCCSHCLALDEDARASSPLILEGCSGFESEKSANSVLHC